jgi:hypothetical protein
MMKAGTEMMASLAPIATGKRDGFWLVPDPDERVAEKIRPSIPFSTMIRSEGKTFAR